MKPVTPLLDIYSRDITKYGYLKNVNMNANSFICNSQTGNNTDIYQQMNGKINCVHTYNGIWLSTNKEWNVDTHNNMDKSK